MRAGARVGTVAFRVFPSWRKPPVTQADKPGEPRSIERQRRRLVEAVASLALVGVSYPGASHTGQVWAIPFVLVQKLPSVTPY